MFITDKFLKMGASHTMCQDYIITGDDPFPYMILSDGCSMVGDPKQRIVPDTDIGSRILCHSAIKWLKEHQSEISYQGMNGNMMAREISLKAVEACRYFETEPAYCLSATLIMVFYTQGNFYMYMFGDGIIQINYTNGEHMYFKHDYSPNFPAYPIYRIMGYEKYKKENVALTVESSRNSRNEPNVMTPFRYCQSASLINNIIIASDGLESFAWHPTSLDYKPYFNSLARMEGEDPEAIKNQLAHVTHAIDYRHEHHQGRVLSLEEVTEDLLTFKTINKGFLQRTVKNRLKKLEGKGFTHYDDLSIGCMIRMEDYDN